MLTVFLASHLCLKRVNVVLALGVILIQVFMLLLELLMLRTSRLVSRTYVLQSLSKTDQFIISLYAAFT